MRMVTYDMFGGPETLHVDDVPRPVPGDNDVLIEVHATSASTADRHARTRKVPRGFGLFAPFVFGFRQPRHAVLGIELAGEIVEVGRNVRAFAVGDRVFAHTGASYGCYVEYKCMPADGPLARIPPGLSYDEAATLSFGGVTALAFLRKARVQPGSRVLVIGASGAVGTAALQLAKHLGATVTAVCSTTNLELVRSLGADRVIDYHRHDFVEDGVAYDIIVDTVGDRGFWRSRRALARGGAYLAIGGSLTDLLFAPLISLATGKRLLAGAPTVRWTAREIADALRELADLAACGELHSHIDRSFELTDIVAAHRYLEAGHKRGNIAIHINARS